jgi:hypothetical protein
MTDSPKAATLIPLPEMQRAFRCIQRQFYRAALAGFLGCD